MSNQEFLNPKTLHKEFGIAESTQAKYRSEKTIPYCKVGGSIFYHREAITEWILNHSIPVQGGK